MTMTLNEDAQPVPCRCHCHVRGMKVKHMVACCCPHGFKKNCPEEGCRKAR